MSQCPMKKEVLSVCNLQNKVLITMAERGRQMDYYNITKEKSLYYNVPGEGNENAAYDDVVEPYHTVQNFEYAEIGDEEKSGNKEYSNVNEEQRTDSNNEQKNVRSHQYESLNIQETTTGRKCPSWLKIASCIAVAIILGFAVLISVLLVLFKKGNNISEDETVYCGNPGRVAHATSTDMHFNFKDTIVYECEAGNGLVSGDLQRTCGENGQWSGSPPVCGKSGHLGQI